MATKKATVPLTVYHLHYEPFHRYLNLHDIQTMTVVSCEHWTEWIPRFATARTIAVPNPCGDRGGVEDCCTSPGCRARS